MALVTAWAQAELDSPGRNLMLAHDRHDVAELNRTARVWREQWGFISDWRITVSGTEWAIGDRVVCRRNDHSLGVRNGTQGTVIDLGRNAEHLDLFTDHGETIRIPAGYLAHARHGYALTGHVSQGESVDRTFVLASPERGGAEWAYVAGSRQRHDLQVFVVHHEAENVEEALSRAWSRSQAKSLALDLVEPEVRGAAMDAARADPVRATPERLNVLADELRARREQAREEARATAEDRRCRADAARALQRAESALRQAERRRENLIERLDDTPPWRRRERAELRAYLARADEDVARHQAEAGEARDGLSMLGPPGDAVEGAGRLGEELARVERRLAERGRGVRDRGREPPGPELSR